MLEVRQGATIVGKSGKKLVVERIDGDGVIFCIGGSKVRLDRVIDVIPPTSINPRIATSIAEGRIEVNLDLIDLSYVPAIATPQWTPPKLDRQPWELLSKTYIDIETNGLDSATDRIFMIGLMNETGMKIVISDPDERVLLTKTIAKMKTKTPYCLIGHNLFNFDLPFIMGRCDRLGVKHPFTYGKHECNITSASVNGQFVRFQPIYWKGVNILDTYQQVAIWDKAAAKLERYDLKSSVIALGLREDRRLELSVQDIRKCWESGDLATLEEYLHYDLDDTQALADFLLPVVYGQLEIVPNIKFQQLAIASPAKKAQHIHEELLGTSAITDERVKYMGGTVALLKPGLHYHVAKIDVSSMYPAIMLRYGLCSRKDTNHLFLGVLEYMRAERLRLKALAKQGDKSASFQEKSLKILLNGSYGFFGTGYYTWNDYEAAALITAYGRKILNLMVEVVEKHGGTVIEIDSDGVFFSHTDPSTVSKAVADALPNGIEIELEIADYGMYVPKAKNYVLVAPNGKTTVKGIYRKRNRYPLEKAFPIQYIKLYFTQGRDAAEEYYREVRSRLADGSMPINELTVTRKIAKNEKKLVELGIGGAGERASYWITQSHNYHKRTGKPNRPVPTPTRDGKYWAEHYVNAIDKIYNLINSTDNITDIQRKELGITIEVIDLDYGGEEVNSIGM